MSTADLPAVEWALVLCSVTDADTVVTAVTDGAVVVGGGFIGLKTTESMARRGLRVTVVELGPQVMAPLGPEIVTSAHTELRASGIGLRLGTGVAKVLPDAVELTGGTLLASDLVLLAVGVRPQTGINTTASLRLGTATDYPPGN